MNPAQRTELFARLARVNPTPKGELQYTNAFELLIAVMLSAQATDISVNKATTKLFPVANTPETLLSLGEDLLKTYIKTIGLFNSKAKNIIATCQLLIDKHGGEVPRDLKTLQTLPGVGRKTANVVLNNAFGQPTIAVDTHLFRVSNRTGLAPGKNVLEVEKGLLRRVPSEYLLHAHHWLILHGRYICQARKPLCDNCPICDICEYKHKTCSAQKTLLTRTEPKRRVPVQRG